MLKDKVVIVTGAGSGIGKSSALAMAEAGAKVVLADVSAAAGNAVLDLMLERGHEALFVPTDISEESDVKNLVDRTVESFGRLDCAFNNAGVEGAMRPLHEIDATEFEQTLAVNLRGTFLCIKYEVLAMRASGSGAIVNMSSVMGCVGGENMAAYSASKFGVVGLTKSAALDYAQQGIRVNAVCPGVVETPMFTNKVAAQPGVLDAVLPAIPAQRLASPDEIAQAALWLCSDMASFVTGVAMPIDGGYTAR